jgi:RHH-type transcriptional regulator, rel operon repressor / antitoxin RelB
MSDIREKHIVCEDVYTRAHPMTETLSIRIDSDTKKRLDALSKRSKRSKSFLAAEAIAAYVASEEWQLGEIQGAIAELESGQEVSHERVAKWLKTWAKPGETKAPR